MGAYFSTYPFTDNIVSNVKEFVTGRKRKREEIDSQDEVNKIIELTLHTPKRKKLVKTAQYIYQTLFEEGKNSDITVYALDHEFHLHKVYLCQSPYFASMFGGSWLEATKKFINIEVIDPLITVESLKIVLGSLYNDEIVLNPMEIVSILATATMFQLDGIIDKCTEVMIETVNPKTALAYYNASSQYGDKKLKDTCINWFLVNLMTHFNTGPISYLRTIPVSLMTELINHQDLFVLQTEFSLYIMLKLWMYLRLHPDTPEVIPINDMNHFYWNRKDDTPFLLTDEGETFILTFQGLRMHNLISHNTDLEVIEKDNIIPRSWLNPVVLKQWKLMLKVNQNDDKGPSSDILEEIFISKCWRGGRIIKQRETHLWRWTGFNHGMDLLMISDGKSLAVKRNHRPEFEQLLSHQTIRQVAIRMTAFTLNEQRQVKHSQTTGIKHFSLSKNEEADLLTLDKELTFPFFVSVNILFTSPETDTKPPLETET